MCQSFAIWTAHFDFNAVPIIIYVITETPQLNTDRRLKSLVQTVVISPPTLEIEQNRELDFSSPVYFSCCL